MQPTLSAILKKSLNALLFGLIGGVGAFVLVAVIHLENRPDLKVWHAVHLDAEFRADSPVSDFKGYLALEDRLFRQLERLVIDRLPTEDQGPINRYHRGSLSDPGRWPRNWNRSFELRASRPVGAVLLLHGMSDAPYSLRAIGTALNEQGLWVVGLRLPGHGTAPSGLVRLAWEDMAAAVTLAMRHLQARVGNLPIYVVGYSVGAALAINYALDALDTHELPTVAKLVLISPAMGVSRLAALSVWQARLGRWLGLPKLAWHSLQPEYNPYKYNSFAINAGDQVHRLTRRVQSKLGAALSSGRMIRFPQVLTFQSVVDATVSATAVCTGLFNRLINTGNRLVLFDINRRTSVPALLTADPLDAFDALCEKARANTAVSLVTNADATSLQVVVHNLYNDRAAPPSTPLAWQWPAAVHSLSHIALPFPEDDPLYGTAEGVSYPGIALSRITLRGESGLVTIPAADILRLRWNPFYPYMEQRIIEFLGR